MSWDASGTKDLISDWSANGVDGFNSDHRLFLAISGTALIAPAQQYVARISTVPSDDDFTRVIGVSGSSGTSVSPALLEYFTTLIAAFRRMDDVEGASIENLRYVRRTIGQLSEYLRIGKFTAKGLAKDLLRCLAQLSQIAGWMAFDAELHGLAQRYFRTGLQAAHSVGDRDIGVHILGSLTYQAVQLNQLREAAELSEIAVRAARGVHPLLGTMAAARAAYVFAAHDDTGKHRSAIAEASAIFERSRGADGGPDYMYWLDEAGVNMLHGEAALLLAMRNSRGSRPHLSQASTLLEPVVSRGEKRYQRDATFFGAALARAYIRQGDLHRGLSLAEDSVRRVKSVSSPRSRALLCGLDRDLAQLRSDRNLREVVDLRSRLQLARAG